MSTRSVRMLQMAQLRESNLLFLPKYETTKGTSIEQQTVALKNNHIIFYETTSTEQRQHSIDQVEADNLDTNAIKLAEVKQKKIIKHKTEKRKYLEKQMQFSGSKQIEEEIGEVKTVDKLKSPDQQNDRKKTSFDYLKRERKIISQKDVQDNEYIETSPESTEEPFQSSGSEYVPDSCDDESDQEPYQTFSNSTSAYAEHYRHLFQSSPTTVASTSKKRNELTTKDRYFFKI